jgi:hypothetical protein
LTLQGGPANDSYPTVSKVLRDTARNETASLIASEKVEGAAVYSADMQKIGRIGR